MMSTGNRVLKHFKIPGMSCSWMRVEYLECGEEELREKIEELKAEGCKLFG